MKVGDVIQDSYGNPAVVLQVTTTGTPYTVMQTVGSDHGNVTSAPRNIIEVTDQGQIDWARDVARKEWVKKGLKRSRFASVNVGR